MSRIERNHGMRHTFAALAVALGAIFSATTAEARSITGVERIVSSGAMSLNVTFEAGETGDSHALYIAYDAEDKGDDIANWAALQRGCVVADDATSATIPVSPLFTDVGYTVARVFLTTSAAPYDTLIESLRQSGTQYIDTGIKPDSTTFVSLDFQFSNVSTKQQRIFGVSSDDGSASFSFDAYLNGSYIWASACQNGKGDWLASGLLGSTDRLTISLDATTGNHVISNHVSGIVTTTTRDTERTNTSRGTMPIFAHRKYTSNTSNAIQNKPKGGYIYGGVITTNSVPARNYMPCALGGRAGLYDSVSGTIFWSADDATNFEVGGSPVVCALLEGETQLSAAPAAIGLIFDYTWRGTAENWGGTDAWTKEGDPATWVEGNNAIFATANATATLAASVSANSIAFSADATVGGTGELTVKSVFVDSGVSATISAPIASAFEKTGAGTLTLGLSRSAETTLSEGTLAMSGSGTTLDWSKLTLGTDPEKPVTVRFEDGAAPTSGAWHLGSGNIISTVVKASGDWSRGDKDITIGSGVGADTTFIHEGGSLTCSKFIRVGTRGAANSTLILSGGVIKNTNADRGSGKEPRTAIGYTSNGTLIVTNGASLAVTGQYLGISDANGVKGIVEIYDGSTIDVAYDVIFGQVSQQGWGEGKLNLHTGGTLATQVIRCSTKYATPADATAEVNFDGGILKANSSTCIIQKHDHLTVNVSENGGTIDNNGKDISIEESFNGPGTINLIGSGMTTFAAGVGAEGGVSVANGTTLALDVTEQSSLGSLTLAAGSKLALSGVTQSSLGTVTLEADSTIDITTPASDVAAFAATTLILPTEGKVTLTKSGGAFGEGVYAICRNSDVTVAEAEERFDFDITDMRVASWSKVDDLLVLTVKVIERIWIAEAGESFSWSEGWGENGWSDGVDAIFETAGAIASVDDDVAANSVKFKENAAINGESTLTPNIVHVAEGKEATINAPTAGELTKTGAGTLTLGSSRTDQTTLSEGMLAMASGATLDLAKLTLGTDPAKPVSLNLGGATLSADLTSCMSATVGGAAGGSVAIDNGVITNTAYLRVWNGSLTLGSNVQLMMNASAERWVCVGGNNSNDESVTTKNAYLVLDGASINKSGTKNVFLGIGDFGSYPSKATMIVKNGGKSEIGDTVYVAQGCEGHLIIDGAGSLLKAYDIKFCNTSRCEVNENGYVVVTNGGTLAVSSLAYGSGAGEGYFRFDGGTLLATAAVTLLPAHEKLHYIVGEKGGTIDNGGNNITIAKGLSGTGTINLTGSGMTTFAAGVGTECGVSVASGTTLALNGSVTFAGPVVFESGSTLSVTAPSCDKAALAAPSISIKGDMIISIPFQRFADGKYKILEMSDAQFGADVLNCLTLNGGKGDELKKYALSVEGNTIYLEVTGGVESYWVGGVGDNRFSVAANWDNGKVPEDGATLDFSGVASKTQINADVDKVYNTILIPVPSGNSFWDYYVQVSGTLHLNTITNATFLSVAADSVLKVDGDVVLNKDAKKLGSTSSKRGCYMFHSNKGRIEIGGNLVNEVTPNNSVLMYISSSPGGVLKMGGVVNNSDKAISLCGNHTTPILCVIGENGLSGKMGFYQYGGSNAEITLKAGDDFAVGIYLTASYPFKFDTSDETETAHTIILDAEINGSGGVTIVGNGRVVANSSADPGTNVVTVEGGATLAINPGKLITNGKMTVNSGATLSLPQSGAVTLGGDLELADGSTLAFNFTERKVGPLLALASEKSLSFVGEGEKNIAVKVSGDVWPVGGKHILTATGGFKAEGVTVSLAEGAPKWAKGVYVNEDGNIVLDVKPRGTRVIVR